MQSQTQRLANCLNEVMVEYAVVAIMTAGQDRQSLVQYPTV